MQLEAARDLREEWGDKPCDHPKLTKEYYRSTQTGDYVCTTCGRAGWGKDWPQKEKKTE